jgi:uncharacterized membrane protein (UPF0127 family)
MKPLIQRLIFCCGAALLTACTGEQLGSGTPTNRNNLAAMPTARLAIKDHPFEVWLAKSPVEIQFGLMLVKEEELAPTADGAERGMLFVFAADKQQGFWMFNTITALDIAYIRSDGIIVKTHTMAPLDTSTYPSVEPAKYALEMRAGRLAALGIFEGDKVELPDGL